MTIAAASRPTAGYRCIDAGRAEAEGLPAGDVATPEFDSLLAGSTEARWMLGPFASMVDRTRDALGRLMK